jgi:hypothetical protein
MAVKSLHQFFYYHSKYLNSIKCREISMGPSIHTIQCTLLPKEKENLVLACLVLASLVSVDILGAIPGITAILAGYPRSHSGARVHLAVSSREGVFLTVLCALFN